MAAHFPVGSIVQHRLYQRGQIIGYEEVFYVIRFKDEIRRVPFESLDVQAAQGFDLDYERTKLAVAEVLADAGAIAVQKEVHKRWLGGEVVLVPGKKDTQEKRIPLDQFLKKIVAVREKLRVLEQKINNHPNLDAADRLELQGYLTRCYGSLTTFNALFSEEESQFKGTSSE